MYILPVLAAIGFVLGFAFLTLSIASGLYYLSELVEEHTVVSKRIITYLIYAVIAVQILLAALDGLPLTLSGLSVVSHLVYKRNLRQFPTVRLTDAWFVSSCVLVGVNHILWFRYFSNWMANPRYPNPTRGSGYASYPTSLTAASAFPSFNSVASFFGICVWLVPFALFVSLSAGDNVLPSSEARYHGDYANGAVNGPARMKTKGMARQVVDGVSGWAGEMGEVMGFWKGDRTRRF